MELTNLFKKMKIKVSCCVPGCPDSSKWHILDYLFAALMTRSLKPYVCVKHHHLFDDVDISDYDPVVEDSFKETAHTSNDTKSPTKGVQLF